MRPEQRTLLVLELVVVRAAARLQQQAAPVVLQPEQVPVVLQGSGLPQSRNNTGKQVHVTFNQAGTLQQKTKCVCELHTGVVRACETKKLCGEEKGRRRREGVLGGGRGGGGTYCSNKEK